VTGPVTSLWRNRDFLRLWTGEAISSLGDEVSGLAFSLLAVLTLHASPGDLAILTVAFGVPSTAVWLVAGMWVDRLRRRPILVVTNTLSAGLIASLPVAWAFGILSLPQLILVEVAFGCLVPFVWAGFEAFLPSIVDRRHLVRANAAITAAHSGAAIVGPGVAGLLVQWLTAPIAMVADAISFVGAALFTASIRVRETVRERSERRSALAEIREGAAVTTRDPVLRSIAAVEGLRFVSAIVWPNYVVFILEVLGLTPFAFGVIGSLGAIGFLIGSLLGPRVTRLLGLGRTMRICSMLILVSPFFMPFAPSDPWVAVPLLVAAAITGAMGDVTMTIGLGSLRQAITPEHQLGRVVSSAGFLGSVAALLGPLVGGVLGEAFGPRRAILVAAVLHVGYPIVVWLSPLRSIREVPADEEAGPQRKDAPTT
jgi:MFS family permease